MITSAQKDYTALLSEAVWPKVENKLLEGVKGGMKEQLAIVLANTRRGLLSDTMQSNIAYLPKLVLPLVRRLFPKLISNNIISTQALQSPTGIIRFLDAYIVDKDGNKVDTGSEFGAGNIYPWKPGSDTYSLPPVSVTDIIVGTGSSQPAIETDVERTTNVSGTLTKIPSEATLFLELALSSASTSFIKFASVDRGGVVKQISSAKGIGSVLGMVDPKTNNYVLTIKTVHIDSSNPTITIRWSYLQDNQKNVVFNNSTSAGTGDHKTMNTMQFDITKINVEAKTRKLGARYSFELMEDYKAEFGENFEEKMVDYLTTTILTEVDSETIGMLASNAKWTTSWDATMPATWVRGINAWYETIMPKINYLSNKIYQQTHVGGATFLVCNPITATIFQGLMQYAATGNPIDASMDISSVKIGTLSNAFNVYVSPLCPTNRIILGFKGKNPEDTGAIYAPYVPVQLQPIAYAEGMPAVMARSRYWMGVLRPDYYAVLEITGNIGA